MLAETRAIIAQKIFYECMKNPEAIGTFVCSVAETVSISELQIINGMFYQALAITQKQKKENQKN